MVLGLVLTACSGSGGGGSTGVLRVGYDFASEFTNTFDPAKSSGNCDDIVTSPIYDTLIHLSPGGGARFEVTIALSDEDTVIDTPCRIA